MSKLLRIELSGYDKNGDRVGTIVCRDKDQMKANGKWITPKIGKQMLRVKGAVKFKRVNVYPYEGGDICSNTATESISTLQSSTSMGSVLGHIGRRMGSSTTS